ncbi:uncharacterized protein METZ01_LOCUS129894, partial [marine metagenome]
DMGIGLREEIKQAFTSIDSSEPIGKAVLEAEGCSELVTGISEGWEIIEKAAYEEGLI